MIDLHIHSTCSDGSMDYAEIVEEYNRLNFRYIAITDHDMICEHEKNNGNVKKKIKVIPGVEISSYDHSSGRKVHLLGYFVDLEDRQLWNLIRKITQSREQASRRIIEKLQYMGYSINLEEVEKYAGEGGVYKQHILHCLKDKGYVRKLFGEMDRSMFKRGGRLYSPIDYVDYRESLKVIKNAGGTAVLAHPGQNGVFNLVPELVSGGLDGIETYHPTHDRSHRRACRELAEKYNLVQIPGSDNHGIYTKTAIDFSELQMKPEEEIPLLDLLEEKL